MEKEIILSKLPYSKPFLFVDEIIHIDKNGHEGKFTFHENLNLLTGHFKNNPVTPGVILIEVMAQIGLVCLGLFLLNDKLNKEASIALTSSEIDFLKPVFPNEKVTVISQKIYFRFGKLKCKVAMFNNDGIEVCRGTIAGMIV